jgi:CubicO group peptidase (beta-lactamase class C family)
MHDPLTTIPAMMRYWLLVFLLCTTPLFAQHQGIEKLVTAEYQANHFNGTLLAVQQGHILTHIQKGYANMQFRVPVTSDTRFPIASTTKLFTAILVLQLVDKAVLNLDQPVSAYVPDLPASCQAITLRALLTHYSGLKNEPVQAYQAPYSTAEFVKKYVVKDERQSKASFNYNNVDYVLLTRVLETVTKKPFAALLRENLLSPLKMTNSGVVQEARVIPNLAYGYHNYTFGRGSRQDTLRNDTRYLSNYAGAGAMYSTATDLYTLVQALWARTLLSASTSALLVQAQQPDYFEEARGYPTMGFYLNDKSFAAPVLERRGSIDGFNSVLLISRDFSTAVIILNNTDTGNLEKLADQVYKLVQ